MITKEKLMQLSSREAAIMNHKRMAKSAVLLPLTEKSGEMYVVFEKRSMNLNHQPGEICFPGGGIEKGDQGPQEAAVRETCEELGLEASDIKVIAPLDIVVSPFAAIIYPYVACIKNAEKIAINHEVEEVIAIPLDFLLNYPPQVHKLTVNLETNEDFPFYLIPQGHNYPFKRINYPQIFYQYEGTVVWGLTAMILTHFLQLINAE